MTSRTNEKSSEGINLFEKIINMTSIEITATIRSKRKLFVSHPPMMAKRGTPVNSEARRTWLKLGIERKLSSVRLRFL